MLPLTLLPLQFRTKKIMLFRKINVFKRGKSSALFVEAKGHSDMISCVEGPTKTSMNESSLRCEIFSVNNLWKLFAVSCS